jgi:hypothetical protein
MYCDFQIRIWERIQIPKHLEEDFINLVIDGEIYSKGSAAACLGNSILKSHEILIGTDQVLLPHDIGGAPTIQVYNDKNEIVFDNGRKG